MNHSDIGALDAQTVSPTPAAYSVAKYPDLDGSLRLRVLGHHRAQRSQIRRVHLLMTASACTLATKRVVTQTPSHAGNGLGQFVRWMAFDAN
jgi:hypothetical protein